MQYHLLINTDECDNCSRLKVPRCAEACPHDAIYPDVNSNYVWFDCELTESPESCQKCIEACPNKAIEIKKIPKAKIKKGKIVYFENPGFQNTKHIVTVISNRLKEADIQAIVVASCSGSSALLLAEAIKGPSVKIVNISVPKEARDKPGLQPIGEKIVKRLSDLGVVCREQFFSDIEEWTKGMPNFGSQPLFYDWQLKDEYKVEHVEKIFNSTLIALGGMGLKTAVECMFSACLSGDINIGDKIISTAGTGWGLDTGIVIKATTPQKCFGKKVSERLDISEILAIPIKKHWW